MNNSKKKPLKKGSHKKPLATPAKPKSSYFYPGLLVACFAFLLYANTFHHGYALDDYSAVTINRYVQQGFAGIPKLLQVDFWHFSNMQLGYYRPLSLITFAIEYQFFGASPHTSHVINALLFALSVFLVFLLVSKLFPAKHILFPVAVSLLFAAHPIHTEIVDNIKGRDELLSFLNIIAMLYLSVRYSETKKTGTLLFSLLFFYLALLSKETALIGIAWVPLILFYTGHRSILSIAKQMIPYVAVIFLFLIQKRLALGAVNVPIPNDIINYPYQMPGVRLASAAMIFAFALKMLIWPHPLRYDYSFNQLPAVTWNSPWAWLGLALIITLIVVGIFQMRKKSPWGFAIAFFLVSVIPLMAFVLLRGGIFAERFLVAPSLGFVIALTLLIRLLTATNLELNSANTSKNIRARWVFVLLILAITAGYSLLTIRRNPAWKESATLFAADIHTGRRSAQNQLHYGSNLVMQAVSEKDPGKKEQQVQEGMAAIREALKIYPTFGDALFRYAYAWEVRMSYQKDFKNVDSAIWYFNQAIRYAPRLSDSYRHLGIIYEWMRRYDVASYYYNKAWEINPLSVEAKQKAEEIRQTKGLDVKVNPLHEKNFK